MAWAGWLASGGQSTCEMCRRLAAENGERPECATCPQEREPVGISRNNLAALELWQRLDAHGRDIDAFAGLPRPLRLEAIDMECAKTPDPEGMRWRVLALDERVWTKRLKEWKGRRKK